MPIRNGAKLAMRGTVVSISRSNENVMGLVGGTLDAPIAGVTDTSFGAGPPSGVAAVLKLPETVAKGTFVELAKGAKRVPPGGFKVHSTNVSGGKGCVPLMVSVLLSEPQVPVKKRFATLTSKLPMSAGGKLAMGTTPRVSMSLSKTITRALLVETPVAPFEGVTVRMLGTWPSALCREASRRNWRRTARPIGKNLKYDIEAIQC